MFSTILHTTHPVIRSAGRWLTGLTLALGALTNVACSTALKSAEPVYSRGVSSAAETPAATAGQADDLFVEYLGVGGYLMRYGDDALMTAPSFTNPGLFGIAPLVPLQADPAKIDRHLPPVGDVQVVLTGHAHYDHLLDVPHMMQQHTTRAHFYGPDTAAHVMAAAIDKRRVHGVNALMARDGRPGTWIYTANRRIRFMAIQSSHAAHLLGMTFMQGHYDHDLDTLPRQSLGWKGGETVAFLIDFLDADGTIAHRVYYQDAANSPERGLVPALPADQQKRVDLALLCVASFAETDNHPETIMANTAARYFVLGHWEDFFGNDLDAEPQWLRMTNREAFFARFDASAATLPTDTGWVLPALFGRYRLSADGALATLPSPKARYFNGTAPR